jgi:hypothetical protein
MYEYACHEGNYLYMTSTLRAGRIQDEAAENAVKIRK